MATYLLLHGAGSDGWYWHRVTPLLEAAGHAVVAPDLPSADDTAGLAAHTDAAVDALGDRGDVVVVAQSLAGFVGPLVCERVPVSLLVMLAAMTPAPGETAGAWWDDTGWQPAGPESRPGPDFDAKATFFHDVPLDVTARAWARGERAQSATFFDDPWPLAAWPAVPTRFLLCRHDRFFPAAFQRRVVRERLGFEPDEMDGGHLPALAHPEELVRRLEAYRAGV